MHVLYGILNSIGLIVWIAMLYGLNRLLIGGRSQASAVRWWTVSAAFFGLFWLVQRDNWWALIGAAVALGAALWERRKQQRTT